MQPIAPSDAEARRTLAEEIEQVLARDILGCWFPAALEPSGGFHEDFDRAWARTGDGGLRHLVYQARLTWTAARAAQAFPAQDEAYRAACAHGLTFLAERQWDQDRGGFYWAVDPQGRAAGHWANEKHAYGQAFGIYAAATAYLAIGDRRALDLAQQAFGWLDAKARDRTHGGYLEALSLEGVPVEARAGQDAIGTPYGCKSLNGHLHLLEALIALHRAWPDARVSGALSEVFEVVGVRARLGRDRLGSVFARDWRAVATPEAWGHEVEAAWMLLDAARELGRPDDPSTHAFARALVDRTIGRGFDRARGGVYAGARLGGLVRDKTKVWWAQAELLKALQVMHTLHGAETQSYWRAFLKTWDFVRRRQLDQANPGWLRAVTASGEPLETRKSDGWTDPYHQARALLDIRADLRGPGPPRYPQAG